VLKLGKGGEENCGNTLLGWKKINNIAIVAESE
jgi:hypothetical protein